MPVFPNLSFKNLTDVILLVPLNLTQLLAKLEEQKKGFLTKQKIELNI